MVKVYGSPTGNFNLYAFEESEQLLCDLKLLLLQTTTCCAIIDGCIKYESIDFNFRCKTFVLIFIRTLLICAFGRGLFSLVEVNILLCI